MRRSFRGSASTIVAPSRYPSSTSTRAISAFWRDQGTSTLALRALFALRLRVRRSPIGPVIIAVAASAPARLREPRDLALARQIAQAEATHAEAAEVRTRPATERAAVVGAHLELRRPRGLHHQRRLRHLASVSLRPGTASRARAAGSSP